jgi:hypothetical protein
MLVRLLIYWACLLTQVVDFGLQIVSSACRCESESKKVLKDWKCTRSVIENRAKKGSRLSFTTRTLTAEKDNLNKWNLGVFAQPKHPLFNDKKTVQEIRSEFLNIDFASVEDRIEFGRKFDKALQLRNAAEAEYLRIIRDTKYLSDRNGRPTPASPRGPSRSDSIYSLPAIPDRPPIIRPLSPVSVFGVKDYGLDEDIINVDNAAGADNDAQNNSEPSSGSSSRTIRAFGRWSRWIDSI